MHFLYKSPFDVYTLVNYLGTSGLLGKKNSLKIVRLTCDAQPTQLSCIKKRSIITS